MPSSGKRALLAKTAHGYDADILCIQETCLKHGDNTSAIQGYTLVGRCDRDQRYTIVNGRGGGQLYIPTMRSRGGSR